MTSRRHIGYIAAAATMLAAFPLSTIFDRWTWLIQCLIGVALVTGAATLARTLRAPVWGQVLAMAGALLVGLTWLFQGEESTAILGIVPTNETFEYFGTLLARSGPEMQSQGIPVQDDDSLLFLTMLGVGAVAICVDVCAVGLRRPALAGLPMLAIYSVPVAVHYDSVPVLAFVVGASGYLWLLVTDNVDRVRRFGRRFTGDGRDIDVWEPSPLAAAGRRLAVVGVLAAIALPFAVPGMTTGLLDRFGTGGNGTGVGPGRGSGSQVNLLALLEGQLNQDQEFPMLQVTTTDPNPYYLRMAVADELTANGFRNRQPTGRVSATSLPDPRANRRSDLTYIEASATVKVTNLDMGLLPVYSQPITTRRLDGSWAYDPAQNVIFSGRTSTKNKTYEFDYLRAEYTPEALRRAQPLDDQNQLQITGTRIPVEVRQIQDLVDSLTAGKSTVYDRVRALYDHFSAKNGYTYSIVAESATTGDAITNFLFAGKSGYCVQYAAALAWLVRVAGIPARVAFGFTQGARDGNTFLLTNLNLHAWTEVYFDGFGWVPFDATPATSIRGSVTTLIAPDVNAPTSTSSVSPGSTTGVGASGDPSELPNPRGLDPLAGEDGSSGGGAFTPGDPRWPGYLVIGGVLLVALFTAPALRRVLLRRRRRPLPASVAVRVSGEEEASERAGPLVVVSEGPEAERARRDAHAAWDELIDTLVDLRMDVDPAETPRATAERIVRDSELADDTARGTRLLGSAEERARYAREPLLTDQLTTSLRSLRRALLARVSRRTRLTAILFPPSVLQRWQNNLITTTTKVVTTLGQARDAVVRVFNPRRMLPARR
jgi:transglutaminase-like putative cysteine protease